MGSGIRGEMLISNINKATIKGKPFLSIKDLIIIFQAGEYIMNSFGRA
jgi:hypothetical protein